MFAIQIAQESSTEEIKAKIRQMWLGDGLVISKVDSLATFLPDGYNKIPINGSKGLIRLLCFESGQSVPLHMHPKGDEYFYVLKGTGKVTVGNEEIELQSGCIVKAPAGVPHQWKNGPQRLTLISILIPTASYELANEVTKMELT